MAATVIVNALPIFPVAQNVGAYPRSAWSGGVVSGAPIGAAQQTVAVAAGGTLTFTTLLDDVDYVLYANVAGQDRYIWTSTRTDKRTTDSMRQIGYAETTAADFTTTATSALALVTGCAVSFNATGKPVWIDIGSLGIANSAASLTTIEVWESGAPVWTGPILTHTAGQTLPCTARVRMSGSRLPAAGPHTWELRAGTTGFGSGTLTLKRNTLAPIHLALLEES